MIGNLLRNLDDRDGVFKNMYESNVLNFQNQALSIPVEILTMIFFLVGPSSLDDPYPYMPLSWVCRYWRSIVIDNPRFWTVLRYRDSSHLSLAKAVISRSKSHKLDVFMYEQKDDRRSLTLLPFNGIELDIFAERSRIRSLFIENVDFFNVGITGSSDFSFPQLESVILRKRETQWIRYSHPFYQSYKEYFHKLIIGPQLRHIELPWNALLLLHERRDDLLQHLSHIEWLKLTGSTRPHRQPKSIACEILESLPNLRVLNLSWEDYSSTAVPVITLPKLQILSLDSESGEIYNFRVPNLDYLSVLYNGPQGFCNWDLLDIIDFSKITNILIGLHARMSNTLSSYPRSFVCISGTNHLETDCQMFTSFHEEGLTSRMATNNYLVLPPKNCFHIPIPWSADIENFYIPLKRATNLVELTLDFGSLKRSPVYFSLLTKLLGSVDAIITKLNIMRCRNFAEVYKLLINGHTASRLERLAYHNSSRIKATKTLLRQVEEIQRSRLRAHSEPLKILELKNFADVSPEWAQGTESLGIQLIQIT